jgi:hypothetical protein
MNSFHLYDFHSIFLSLIIILVPILNSSFSFFFAGSAQGAQVFAQGRQPTNDAVQVREPKNKT